MQDELPDHIAAAIETTLDAVEGLDAGDASAVLTEVIALVLASSGCGPTQMETWLETLNRTLPGRVQALLRELRTGAH